jgi:hypothetical protein
VAPRSSPFGTAKRAYQVALINGIDEGGFGGADTQHNVGRGSIGNGSVQREAAIWNIAFAIMTGILIGTAALTADADQTALAPPRVSELLFEVMADGVQIYTCEAKERGLEWSFKAPQANLFDNQGRPTGTHFAGPTWKMDDGSAVVGEVMPRPMRQNQVQINGRCCAPRGMRAPVSEAAELFRPQQGRRLAEMACEQGDLQEVGVAGARRKVPHLHVLDHALPKDCHGKLLCEMECAARSAPSCRNRSLSMMQAAYDN